MSELDDADLTLELPGGVPMDFRRIPRGEFRMGSRDGWPREQPAHRVRIARDFYLGTFPVTQEQFAAWTRSASFEHENSFSGSDRLPAESLDWHAAGAFCAWLNGLAGFPDGWSAGLPTEALWEFACRAGTKTDYAGGDGETALREAGWFRDNSEGRTHPVGSREPNAWGLFDMHGNVLEWCADAWDASAYRGRLEAVEDPVAEEPPDSNSAGRVVRGGSWDLPARYCRSAFRGWWWPGYRFGYQGFRVCLLPGPETAGRGAPTQPPRRLGATPAAAAGRRGGERRSGPERHEP